jgi:glycine/serine hydroxymethyltransferase
MSDRDLAFKVLELVKQHDSWRSSCLNLVPSENVTSRLVRLVLTSDLGHRYAEGKPFKRYYCGTRFIDEIEALEHRAGEEALQVRARLGQAHLRHGRELGGVLRLSQALGTR